MKHCSCIVFVTFLFFLLTGCDSEKEKDRYGREPQLTFQRENYTCEEPIVICVNNTQEFLDAVQSNYKVILLNDGEYDFGVVEISSERVIQSKNISEAIVIGSSYLKLIGDDITVRGIIFLEGASPSGGDFLKERFGSIFVKGNNVNILDSQFKRVGVGSTVDDGTGIAIHIFDSHDVLIENNLFINSYSIAIKSDDYSKRINIVKNDFVDSPTFGGAGEVAHFGNALSLTQGVAPFIEETNNIFAYNYIHNWNLEKELISIKSDRNRVFNNFIENSGDSAIVVRMGNNNQIYKNIMVGNKQFPVRISGERNVIESNIFCGEGYFGSLHKEMIYTEERLQLYNSYWAAIDNVFKRNVYSGYNDGFYIDEGDAVEEDFPSALPQNNLFFENKVFSKDSIFLEPTYIQAYNNIFNKGVNPCDFL